MKIVSSQWVNERNAQSGTDVYLIKGLFRKKVYMLRAATYIQLPLTKEPK